MAVATSEELHHFLPSLEPLWHHKAPRSLVECRPGQDAEGAWKVWQKHLRSRKKPAIPPFNRKHKSPLLWGWPGEWDRTSLNEVISSPGRSQKSSSAMIERPRPTCRVHANGCAGVCDADVSPRIAGRHLVATIGTALRGGCRSKDTSHQLARRTPRRPAQQLLAGELSLALSCLFPEVRAMRALRREARSALSEAIIELTDGQGLPDARLLDILGPLFACWTRARWLGEQLKRGPWSRPADLQFQWLVRHAIRLADSNGRFLLSPGEQAWNTKLFEVAIELAGDRGDRDAARIALPPSPFPKMPESERKTCPIRRSIPIGPASRSWPMVGRNRDARLAVAYVANR